MITPLAVTVVLFFSVGIYNLRKLGITRMNEASFQDFLATSYCLAFIASAVGLLAAISLDKYSAKHRFKDWGLAWFKVTISFLCIIIIYNLISPTQEFSFDWVVGAIIKTLATTVLIFMTSFLLCDAGKGIIHSLTENEPYYRYKEEFE